MEDDNTDERRPREGFNSDEDFSSEPAPEEVGRLHDAILLSAEEISAILDRGDESQSGRDALRDSVDLTIEGLVQAEWIDISVGEDGGFYYGLTPEGRKQAQRILDDG